MPRWRRSPRSGAPCASCSTATTATRTPTAQLAAVTDAIRGSVPPDEMCTFIRYMVPSMNLPERVDMLGGMHAGAPPEIFEQFRAAAEACLPAPAYRAVADAAGFA